MDLLQVLSDKGVVDRARLPSLQAELAKPGTLPEAVLQKEGILLKDILAAKGDYYSLRATIVLHLLALKTVRLRLA